MVSEDKIVKDCISGKRYAFDLLYKKYAASMLGLCMRYCKNKAEAEDVLQEGFIKVFKNICKFRQDGSFEGWMKRIMVNTSINNYYSNIKHNNKISIDENIENIFSDEDDNNIDVGNGGISSGQMMELIQELPDGYRIVFNLYVFEDYSHKEIAEMINVSENTSKSQLSKARKSLRKKIIKIREEILVS